MLSIDIPETELFDEENDKFIHVRAQKLTLEHSLISISKWETKHCKAFLTKENKTSEEILDYIQCMIIKPPNDENVIKAFTSKEINEVVDYINSKKTATTVTFFEKKKNQTEKVITSELIYYWMFSAGISIECEKWPIDRLFALIKIFSAKNTPKQKGSNREYQSMVTNLNAQRRAELNSKG